MNNTTADFTDEYPEQPGESPTVGWVRPLDPPPPSPPLFPYASSDPSPQRKPRRRWVGPIVGAVAGAALLALVLWGTGRLDLDGGPEVREIIAESNQVSAAAVARKVVPSIVTIDVGTDDGSGFELFGSGSGVVLTSNGKIVTNHHVVTDADAFRVTFSDGRIYEATLIGSDRRTDLAVLTIAADGLIPIDIGSTTDAEIGQTAIAVGSPLGLDGGPSVTVGVLSAFGRQVRTGSPTVDTLFDMLQTDAPITQGSSGGALVDAEGKLLGITSAIGVSAAGAEGIGFAIPVELMERITDEIIESGAVQHAFLGISLDTAFAENSDGSQTPAGAFVTQFAIESSAAENAGVQEEDLIVAFDGNTVSIPDDLITGLRNYRVGDTVTLSIKRGSDQIEIPVVLGVRPEDL